MKKVIGWIRFLIGIWLLVVGLIALFGGSVASMITPAWIATLAGLYFVLGAYKHMMKEKGR